LPVGYTLSNGKATGSKVFKDGTEIGTLIVYGDVDGDGEIDLMDVSKMVGYMCGGETELPEMYQKIAADINHDGILTNEDLGKNRGVSTWGPSELDEWVQEINQNVPAKIIKEPEYITAKELLEMFKIANNNEIEEEVYEYDTGETELRYKITLNKEYTYLELYNHMNKIIGNGLPVNCSHGNLSYLGFMDKDFNDITLFEEDASGKWEPTEFANNKIEEEEGQELYILLIRTNRWMYIRKWKSISI